MWFYAEFSTKIRWKTWLLWQATNREIHLHYSMSIVGLSTLMLLMQQQQQLFHLLCFFFSSDSPNRHTCLPCIIAHICIRIMNGLKVHPTHAAVQLHYLLWCVQIIRSFEHHTFFSIQLLQLLLLLLLLPLFYSLRFVFVHQMFYF